MTDPTPILKRPDPDALLAEVEAESAKKRRGKLKIFFGMSPGVGKTYAMLEEARQRAAEEVDVLVGYAEPHIRPDTEGVLIALNILPYRLVEYRGSELREFDLDAALARRPTICCVDELAHTNAPGMRHTKRWQDVIELLDAGIHVYTTLNVQHLESVNDLVERITGVRVRETLPDAIFDAADDVELIDIAPEELLERLREGRIYRPEQAERAGQHFFTKGNLIALRELALRRTAERVDEQMLEHRRDGRLRHVVPASERVLVCVGPSPLSARLVRSARRLAAGMRAKLIAASVESQGAQSPRAAKLIAANLKLAEELGAQVVNLNGRNVAAELIAFAITHNVTKIVVGKPERSRWRDLIFGSIVDDLIRNSGDIDVYVIRGKADGGREHRPVVAALSGRATDWRGHLAAVVTVALTTLIGWPLFHRFGIANANVLMLYLLAVLWIATRHSRGAAVVASVLSVAAFDVVFVPPFYSLAISDRQYIVTFLVMLLTALIISTLTHRIREQTLSARLRERRTLALLGLSSDLAASRSIEQIASVTQRHAFDLLAGQTVLLLADSNGKLTTTNLVSSVELNAREFGAAEWAAAHEQAAGRWTTTLPTAVGTYVPMKGPRGVNGVLALISGNEEPFAGERRQIIEAFAAQAALAIERANLADETRLAWERVESEFLRNTLLSGVSHDLRTPLAGIIGAATALTDANGMLGEYARRELLDTLVEQAHRMERVIGNLLDMTRMEAGGIASKKEWTPIEEPIGAALRQSEQRLAGRVLRTHIPSQTPLIFLDPVAIEQVMSNLLDNAIEYTPPQSPIDISVTTGANQMVIELADRGPGLPPGTEKRVFEKFFRAAVSGDKPSRGVGLGLAICRAIVAAHGGTIEAMNQNEGGALFRVTLPIGGTPPWVDSSL